MSYSRQEDTRDGAITQLYNVRAFAVFEHKKGTVIVAGEGVDATVVEGPADRVLLLAYDRLCAERKGTGKGAGGHRPSETTSTHLQYMLQGISVNMTDILCQPAVQCLVELLGHVAM